MRWMPDLKANSRRTKRQCRDGPIDTVPIAVPKLKTAEDHNMQFGPHSAIRELADKQKLGPEGGKRHETG